MKRRKERRGKDQRSKKTKSTKASDKKRKVENELKMRQDEVSPCGRGHLLSLRPPAEMESNRPSNPRISGC